MSVPPTLNGPVGQHIVLSPNGSVHLEWRAIEPPPAIPSFASLLAHAERARTTWSGSNGTFFNNNPLPAPPDASDTWHLTTGFPPLPYSPISIPFAPTHGPGTLGVALSELVGAGRGVSDPAVPIVQHIPPPFRGGGTGEGWLVLEWPGQARFVSSFQLRTHAGEYISRGLLAMQVANAFHYYYTLAHNEPSADARATAVPLLFDHLRLLEVVSFNAADWYVRVVVVSRPGL
ncbi:hypothetical protein HMN09_00481000 [Mycena chlorophos]|uniref:Uncharacterized protein n=1 Tax=Mycena chlorophos TaxID=658473 RepID=A0A8H6TF25_MYCCL|nr:hypothetical protein HMN09_00481000 [Mycena chlorophos]